MKLILFLLRTNWRVALMSALVGAMSGGASLAIVVLILRTIEAPDASTALIVILFALLCAVVLLTRIVSQVLVSRLT